MNNQNKTHRYGLLARPYLSGSTQPTGEALVENFQDSGDIFSSGREERSGRKVHAIIEYDRPLEAWEIQRYSLHPINSN